MSIGTAHVRVHRRLLLERAVYDRVLEREGSNGCFPPNL